jgi:hypothetical protein
MSWLMRPDNNTASIFALTLCTLTIAAKAVHRSSQLRRAQLKPGTQGSSIKSPTRELLTLSVCSVYGSLTAPQVDQ